VLCTIGHDDLPTSLDHCLHSSTLATRPTSMLLLLIAGTDIKSVRNSDSSIEKVGRDAETVSLAAGCNPQA
jgi:hypothetical protein